MVDVPVASILRNAVSTGPPPALRTISITDRPAAMAAAVGVSACAAVDGVGVGVDAAVVAAVSFTGPGAAARGSAGGRLQAAAQTTAITSAVVGAVGQRALWRT